ncbi:MULTISPECIES: tRNA (adenosine(37)-N6)-threonylcarbamoyltransferase complex ATPase subunit type 1 TsaE [unclassified Leptolyngbya]|uniref:tRNA (adenosine(37)-N6)-threonylcarbamoyltransferase complex ATPase subunit type 1 TsaE n=1 Tax=unclassified Leptolyngbya TaxID=2650499 RepID=UPI00168851F4|nr:MULTISPECIES: tRNA (adenosine(37)-N6)-threonylcarbamoyltransferase complex ATPase subunit type 1 TsaE [unclassified Leptolyngbya]MBD1912313.1 tRNA (adenosine(37)-N6)-threonylcarbamoyltransferase complex ATPase subunit type 1 TsaE [Leptolyngbya sp. FACHB-8]MBD2158051.1 tRNA (adenosine(37)-N6)-threonylcarbamoyltransferase complex ATPase subunit type 1 TsaE [Leptolyngbya sp. FACHB-16]
MSTTASVISLADADATLALGEFLGRSLPPGTVLLLHGNLGSGKTTLVQGIGRALGITDPILSPTFTLISEYYEGRIPLYHLDLYRLTSEEAANLYLETYWDGNEYPPGLVAIEWAERLAERPESYGEIELVISSEAAKSTTSAGRQATLINNGPTPTFTNLPSVSKLHKA